MSRESDFLDWVQARQRRSAFALTPAGDDLAVLRWNGGDLLIVGADQMLDGVHFDSRLHSPRLIGRKAMNRNLSDCAAMACLPAAAIVTVALPSGAGIDYAKELYLGLCDAGEPFDCPVVGGDTGSWAGRLAISVAILGRSAGVEPVLRSGAVEGDGVYVTGPLGGSIRGRHMSFEPRVRLARMLAEAGGVSAMLDLSDGLSRDLPRLCRASGAGATVWAEAIPIHPDAIALAKEESAQSPPGERAGPAERALGHALHDGEDYELLFTGRPAALPEGVTRVGTIVAGAEIRIERAGRSRPLEAMGWEHSL